jgi:hypothetical protein
MLKSRTQHIHDFGAGGAAFLNILSTIYSLIQTISLRRIRPDYGRI